MKPPYGISNFKKIIEQGFTLVDKSAYLRLLENESAHYLFALRPRRFGKSLFLSMMAYYYGVEYRDQFSQLFGHLDIGRDPTPKHNQFHVLNLDFSAIPTDQPERTRAGFFRRILIGIREFERRYGAVGVDYTDTDEPAQLLDTFFSSHLDKRMYVLVDEYDHFANEILGGDPDSFKKIIGATGYVRKAFESIKTYAGKGVVDRFFGTGVTPVTLDGLTSGFNIGKNIGGLERYAALFGFTSEEVSTLVTDTVAEVGGSAVDEVLADLRTWYNGYGFCEEGPAVYNPDMILYFLGEYLATAGAYPKDLVDVNVMSDYGKIRRLFHVVTPGIRESVLDDLTRNREIRASVTRQFTMDRPFGEQDFVSLLHYMGLVSISGRVGTMTRFRIPNLVIERLYWQFFLDEIRPDPGGQAVQQSLESLAFEGRIEPLLQLVASTLKQLSNRDMRGFDERYIKALFVAFASQSSAYNVLSELEAERGYLDVLLLRRPPYHPTKQFLFEIKYLKKSDQGLLEKRREEARAQLLRYCSSPFIQGLSDLVVASVVFLGETVAALDLIPFDGAGGGGSQDKQGGADTID